MGMRVTEMVPPRYPEDRPLHEDLGLWQVLHVKSNWEKKVAAYLMGKNISYYMPLQRIRRTVGCFRSTRITEVPLFRGYVCFALERDEHQLLYGSGMFVRILQVEDQERFVNELKAVGRAIETEDDLVLRPGVVPGRKVVILSGTSERHGRGGRGQRSQTSPCSVRTNVQPDRSREARSLYGCPACLIKGMGRTCLLQPRRHNPKIGSRPDSESATPVDYGPSFPLTSLNQRYTLTLGR